MAPRDIRAVGLGGCCSPVCVCRSKASCRGPERSSSPLRTSRSTRRTGWARPALQCRRRSPSQDCRRTLWWASASTSPAAHCACRACPSALAPRSTMRAPLRLLTALRLGRQPALPGRRHAAFGIIGGVGAVPTRLAEALVPPRRHRPSQRADCSGHRRSCPVDRSMCANALTPTPTHNCQPCVPTNHACTTCRGAWGPASC